RAEIVPLHDPFGPALTSQTINVLIVSKETESIACELNKKRRVNNLPSLKVIAIRMIMAETAGPISTTRIRDLEIDHEGKLLKY
ncbi:hypothetical protein KAS06_03490, partial [Candidatus Bathyarchaeota archaeon]|nr:hypothetical protein [Candidatus Bathyarchaeota archaeon]